MKNVYIAGAGGYIGSMLSGYLKGFASEYNISCISLRESIPTADKLLGCDVIIFAAGLAHVKETAQNRTEFYEVNCHKAVQLAEAAKKAGVKQFVYMSSMSVYGLLTGYIDADTEERPAAAYGASKLRAEKELRLLETESFSISIIRAPMVYGPNCPGNYRRLRELALKIRNFPKIKNQRSMIYIGNLCAFIKKIIDEEKFGIFMPQNENYICSSDLVQAIAAENGRKIRLIPFPACILKIFRFAPLQKLFGSLKYDKTHTVNDFSFARSVHLTENGWGVLPPSDIRHPEISVVIPSYNCAEYLSYAIDSALMQEVDLEIIVVDDASTDNTAAVMEKYSNEHKVRYIKNNKNSGVSASRRIGVAAALGAYIAFLDADDIWAETKLKRQLELLKKTGYVICATGRELMDVNGRLSGRVHPIKTEFSYAQLLKENFISCSSVVIRSEAAREFPMMRDDAHEDYICWLSVLKKYGKGCGINEPLIKYRVSRNGKSGSKLHSSLLTYRSYRVHGFGVSGSCFHLAVFSFHTIIRYLKAYIRKK